MKYRFLALASCAVLGLSACSDGVDSALKGVLSAGVHSDKAADGALLVGSYSTEFFSEAEVKKLVATQCDGGTLASFGQTVENGVTQFNARCSGASAYGRGSGSTYVKVSSDRVRVATTHAKDGPLVHVKGEMSL
ncbi:MAG: hypothetical protein OIF47_02110 [Marinibacterium sp.]|nr:hypothetical protein [Marinibacterium sp.]